MCKVGVRSDRESGVASAALSVPCSLLLNIASPLSTFFQTAVGANVTFHLESEFTFTLHVFESSPKTT